MYLQLCLSLPGLVGKLKPQTLGHPVTSFFIWVLPGSHQAHWGSLRSCLLATSSGSTSSRVFLPTVQTFPLPDTPSGSQARPSQEGHLNLWQGLGGACFLTTCSPIQNFWIITQPHPTPSSPAPTHPSLWRMGTCWIPHKWAVENVTR